MPKSRPYVLTIAGFDPSGGAGLNADLKVFESIKVNGLSVCSALTVQTEDQFKHVEWTSEALILDQLNILLKKYSIAYCKIGLVQNASILSTLISLLKAANIFIIWDPILSTSTGFTFNHDIAQLNTSLKHIDLITPNWIEYTQLFGKEYTPQTSINHQTMVYLKGGHNKTALGNDYLIHPKYTRVFNAKPGKYSPKHGSGCILSAALCAYLSKGYPINKASLKAKRYIEKVLSSNSTLLAWH